MVDSSDVEGLVKQLRDLQLEQAEVIRKTDSGVTTLRAPHNLKKLEIEEHA